MPTGSVGFDEITRGDLAAGTPEVVAEIRRKEALLKAGALQNAIPNSSNFSSIIGSMPRQGATVRAEIPF